MTTATVAYLTKRFPRLSETFILDEILALEAAGVPLRLYAIAHPQETVLQPDVARVGSSVTYLHAPTPSERSRFWLKTLAAHLDLMVQRPVRYLSVVVYVAVKRHHLSTVRHFVEAGLLARHLKADNARHLHAAFAHGPASVAHFVHLLTGIPFSFAAHAKDLHLSAPDLLARKVAAASFVLVCSESAAQSLRAISGPHSGKILLSYHGVDLDRFQKATQAAVDDSRQPLRLLAVGRLVDKKGYPILLEALASVIASGRRLTCDVVGAGPRRVEIEQTIARLGLDRSVRLLGATTQTELAQSYARADAFVQASVVLADGDRDGIPNAVLEAMASGLPVLATRAGGIPEVVHDGITGLLAPAGDSQALAAKLCQLADEPALRDRLGSAARAYIEEHFNRSELNLELARRCFGASPALAGSGPKI